MPDRRDNRVRAYRYIFKLARKVNMELGRRPEQGLADAGYVSLDDLMKLKDGLADPSREVVAVLRGLFSSVATEAEIDAHLVTPFQCQFPQDPGD